jgi:pescadillo
LGRNEVDDASRLEKSKSRMTLDHLIKERYPTFVDALRDLDDALSMLFLFANLPSTSHAPPKAIALCQRLCLEFQHYLIVSRSLRRSFLSIKGIYYQATIQGQDILWLVPYKFVQKMAGDIDFRIMGTFIEFYTTLLGFVNYRLYTTVGLVYPPKFSSKSDEQGGELGAYTLEGRITSAQEALANGDIKALENGSNVISDPKVNGHAAENALSSMAQAEADKLALVQSQGEDIDTREHDSPSAQLLTESIDTFHVATTQDADILQQPQYINPESLDLFSDFTFFLSREAPKAALEFILKAFGCKKIGWDAILGDSAFTMDENDSKITHQIVDRPPYAPLANNEDEDSDNDSEPQSQVARPSGPLRVPGRIYVQPQWVWDCVNQGRLLRPDLYVPGATLPPHLSPWVKSKQGEYDPTAPLQVQEKEGEAELDEAEAALEQIQAPEISDEAEELSSDDKSDSNAESESINDEVLPGEGMKVDSDGSDEEEREEVPQEEWDGLSEQGDDDISDGEQERDQYQKELEAEAAGISFSTDSRQPGDKLSQMRKQKAAKERREQEELDRQKMMMPNKKRKLFDKMQYGNRKRDADAEKLRQKRRRIEMGLLNKS